ncbi:MAG: hypothetical protein KDD47_06650 [Acidobacteria bacterium]|nr:hypothetical protein [Acidobacteriota bacterium]
MLAGQGRFHAFRCVVLGLILVACGAKASGAGSLPPLPEPISAEGRLPRSYLGWELGQPAPDLPTTSKDSRYPEATVYVEKLAESPRTLRRAYVYEGSIFLIEWVVQDASLERERVAAAFAERLGPASDSKWIPKNLTNWSDGVGKGSTGITIHRRPGSEWLRVAVEDVGWTTELFSR